MSGDLRAICPIEAMKYIFSQSVGKAPLPGSFADQWGELAAFLFLKYVVLPRASWVL